MLVLKSDRAFLRLATVTLIFLYLVILAGSVVRATGSGMGCPDWPKCFGYYIPPTDPSQVEFQPNHFYSRRAMVIVGDVLWRANVDFTSATSFRASDWEKYPEHDYATFDVGHTWTEYINRLLGALSGAAMGLLTLVALLRVRQDWRTLAAMLAGMSVMGFVIWLGAVVVQTNLAPFQITLHMLSAMVLVAVVIYCQARVRKLAGEVPQRTTRIIRGALVFGLVLTLDQVVFGTQVRQQIDTIHSAMAGFSRESWIGQLGLVYLYHKIGAGVVMVTNVVLFVLLYRARPQARVRDLSVALLLVVLGEYGIGVFMHHYGIPAYAQPLHLLLAMLLFGVQLSLLLRTSSRHLPNPGI